MDFTEIQLSEEEVDQKLLLAMEIAKNEPSLSSKEAAEFEKWLKAVK